MKLTFRVLATAFTLFVADLVYNLVSTLARLEMNAVAVGQLRDSDSAYLKFTMFQHLLTSGWGSVTIVACVVVILFFIWKGQFKNV